MKVAYCCRNGTIIDHDGNANTLQPFQNCDFEFESSMIPDDADNLWGLYQCKLLSFPFQVPTERVYGSGGDSRYLAMELFYVEKFRLLIYCASIRAFFWVLLSNSEFCQVIFLVLWRKSKVKLSHTGTSGGRREYRGTFPLQRVGKIYFWLFSGNI